MFKTLQSRKYTAELILLIAILGAIYIAIPGDGIGLPQVTLVAPVESGLLIDLIDVLNRKASAHLLGHILIFGGVAALLGEWGIDGERGSSRLAFRYVILGALLMEAGQVTVGYSDDTLTDLILGVSFDLIVDILAAGGALWLTRRYSDSLTLAARRLRLA